MKKINYILVSLFLILGSSCVKDGLNRELKEFNDVTIEGLEKIYNVQLGGPLRIEPTITSRFSLNEDDYDFVWYKYHLAPGTLADTIGYEKILDTRITNVQPGVAYFLTLKMTSKVDKTFTLAKAELNVSGEFSGGVMVLTKTDNKLDLAFIKNEGREIRTNLYSDANDGANLPATANSVYCLNPIPPRPTQYKRILVATNDSDLGFSLSHDGFVFIEKMRDKFLIPFPEVEDYQIYSAFNSRASEFMLIGGRLYDRHIESYSDDVVPKYNSEILCLTDPTDFELSSVALPSAPISGEPILYDNKHGRFMYKTTTGVSFSFFKNNKDGTAFAYFDPGKLGGMKLLSAGYYDDAIDNIWILMDDTNTGNRRLLGMSYALVNWLATFRTKYNKEITRDMAPNLFEAKSVKSTSVAFVPGTIPWVERVEGIGNAFVYVVNNKLYFYNIPSDFEYVIVDGDKEGFTIDDVFVHETFFLNDSGEKEKFTRIALAIRDNSASGKKGGVVYYKVQFLGGISASQYFKEVGFCDQVISLDEKEN